MENWRETIISQYATSPTLVQLIENYNGYISPDADLDAFYALVWNIDTAVGWGLDVWGRIVGVGRVVSVPGATGDWLGFEEATDAQPFNQAPFYTGGPDTDNYLLTDSAYRVLILAKALANISDGSIASINQILLALFPGRGNAYCTDGLNMTMTYTFSFALTPVELAIVSQTGVLPRPAGVSATVVT